MIHLGDEIANLQRALMSGQYTTENINIFVLRSETTRHTQSDGAETDCYIIRSIENYTHFFSSFSFRIRFHVQNKKDYTRLERFESL